MNHQTKNMTNSALKLNLLGLPAAALLIALQAYGETIKIGVISPLTGPAAEFGLPLQEGVQMAYERWQNSHKQDLNIELIIHDEKCLPREAVTAYYALRNEKVGYIIGAGCSSSTLAIAPLAEREHVILFTPLSAAAKISEAGDFIFRNHTSSAVEAKHLAAWAAKHYKKIALLYDDASDAFQGEARAFSAAFPGTIIEIPFHGGRADYRTEALRAKSAGVDALFVTALTPDTITILKELDHLGIKKPILADKIAGGPDFLRAAGPLAQGVVYFVAAYNKQTNPEFWRRYKGKTGKDPTIFIAQSYDTFNLLAQALEKCGEDTACTRDYLYGVKNYPGAGGAITIDKNGDVIKEIAIMRIQSGQHVRLE